MNVKQIGVSMVFVLGVHYENGISCSREFKSSFTRPEIEDYMKDEFDIDFDEVFIFSGDMVDHWNAPVDRS
jgi:hypothetical protein